MVYGYLYREYQKVLSLSLFFLEYVFVLCTMLILIYLLFKFIIGKKRICKICDSRDHMGPPHGALQPFAAPTALCNLQ
jgi:hypothetical protein